MYSFKSTIIYGFALFAMFFGSGNLVFPIQVGQTTEHVWIMGFLGIFLTGILLPFLGLFVIKLHRGSYTTFFEEGGALTKAVLPLFTLSLLGSFGVVPRCITVAHAGISYIIPQIPLAAFSIILCFTIFFLCLKDERMINIVGKWMSPILLVALFIIITSGVLHETTTVNKQSSAMSAFVNGFTTGYQTMDLFAAFFFSSITFMNIQKLLPAKATNKEIIIFAIRPSILGMLLLSITYLGLVFLGSHFSYSLTNVKPEYMLATIVNESMGKAGVTFLALVILFSCITTAIALSNTYARYLHSLRYLRKQNFATILAGVTTISFVVSLFDFRGIAAFLGPALEMSYPSMIALTVLSMFTRKMHTFKILSFYTILALTVFYHILSP